MSWHDKNRKEDSASLGGKVAFMIGWGWLCFTIATFFAISLFWDSGVDRSGTWGPISDGPTSARWGYSFVAALFGLIPAAIFGLWICGRDVKKQTSEALAKQAQQNANTATNLAEHLEPVRRPGFSGLTLGTSTGFLADRGHYPGLNHGKKLHLSADDVCKNIFAAGGIGGGKTTRLVNPVLHQVLAQDCSALIFDIKGDFRREVDFIAGRVQRSYQVVGDGGITLNLFRGCTPEVAASYLKSCFIASGSASGDGAFWVEAATNYCRNLLMLIKLAKIDYSIAGLADLAFSESNRMAALKAAREREQSQDMDPKEVRIWNIVLGYMVDSVSKWDDKYRNNVQATCESVLNPFVSPDLVDAFSVESQHGEADLYDLLNKPEIFLVNLPRHKFGAAGSRFAYLLIKLRFFTMMGERRARPDVNQDRYVAFFCDEYQAIVDAVSDTDFWDKSRSSKCFGVVSMQGFSSLVQAVGNLQAANAIFQNWRQRFVFRTEDNATLEMVQRTLGAVDVHVTSTSSGSSESVSQSGSFGSPQTHSTSQSNSYNESTGLQRQSLMEANDFRLLDAQFALFMGNVGDKACDDVIEVSPLYVP
jgi:hypothetical protein